MIATFVVAVALACYFGLTLVSDRARGVSLTQIGTVLGAILLFVALPKGEAPVELLSRSDPILGLGIGVLSATAAAMGYHLYLGRFTSIWAARGIFLIVAIVIALSFAAFLAMIR